MNLQVEVMKTDLPCSATFLSCRIEAPGSGEVIKDSSSLLERGIPKLPTLGFTFKKASTQLALYFTASTENGEDEVGSCLYPLTFNNQMTRLLGQMFPPNLAEKTHLVYLTCKVLDLDIEKMVGKVWFRIKDFKASRPSSISSVNWLDMKHFQQSSRSVVSAPGVEEFASREAQALCVASVPGNTAVVSVLFHSVTMLDPNLSSYDTLTIACMGSQPKIREGALFNEGEGPIRTVPTLRPVTLKCDHNDTVLELHVADPHRENPCFSASCPLTDLVPFQQYNWEYNWRWVPGVGGFAPEHSLGNLERNVTVSIVYWPPSSDKLHYEGLEIFVKEVEFHSQHEQTDLVLACQLLDVAEDTVSSERADTPPYKSRLSSSAEDVFEDRNLNTSVIKYSSNDTSASGYYFFPSDPHFSSTGADHQIAFTLYSTSHNTDLWWRTTAKSKTSLDLSEALRRALSRPNNKEGVRWEMSGDAISNASPDTLRVHKLTGIVRWKQTKADFLGLDTIQRLSELPPLSEVSEIELGRFLSDSQPSFGQLISGRESGTHDAVWKAAMAKMGRDILQLREENEALKRENRDYEKFVLEMESSIIVTAANQNALLPLTKNDLIHKVVELSERLSTEMETRKMFQNKVHKLQNSLIKKNDIEVRYTELQEAHEAQQQLVRDLQSKISKYKKCWETCKKQETVIKQLLARAGQEDTHIHGESYKLLTDRANKLQIVDTHERSSRSESLKNFREELSQARNRFLELEEKVAHISEKSSQSAALKKRVSKRPSSPPQDEVGDRMASLEGKLEVATARERAVIEELKNNAIQWAKEKSEYETEIAKLRGRHLSSLQQDPGTRHSHSEQSYSRTRHSHSEQPDSSTRHSHSEHRSRHPHSERTESRTSHLQPRTRHSQQTNSRTRHSNSHQSDPRTSGILSERFRSSNATTSDSGLLNSATTISGAQQSLLPTPQPTPRGSLHTPVPSGQQRSTHPLQNSSRTRAVAQQ